MKTLAWIFILIFITSEAAHAVCSSPAGVAGQIQWISADSKVKYCDGTSWIDTSQSTGASCSGTTAGTIQNSSGTARYCNGTNWITMSSGTSLGASAGITAGTFTFDTGSSKLKFSNGTNWYDTTYSGGGSPVITTNPANGSLGCATGSVGLPAYAPITVTNTGSGTTSTIGISFVGGNAASFSVSSNTCTTLGAGANCTITVSAYTPLTPSYLSTTIVISATTGGTSTFTQEIRDSNEGCGM